MRRYLSLLDTAVELELPGYQGARLPRRQQVPIFPQPLITDRARCKYRWVGSWGRGGEGEMKGETKINKGLYLFFNGWMILVCHKVSI